MISLCTTYDGHEKELLQGILKYVQMIEVSPDGIAVASPQGKQIHPNILQELKGVNNQVDVVVHGVGLSIGSYDGWNDDYFLLVDELMDELDIKWHSEHLGFVQVDGQNLNTMLSLPRTEEVIKMLVSRIGLIHNKYPKPFLIENIASFFPAYNPSMSDAEFLNRIAGETGCGLILDLYNMECDEHNFGFDIPGFLRELDLNNVKEIHLAGGSEKDGFQMDVHSQKVAGSTMVWLDRVLQQHHKIEAITYEVLPEAIRASGRNFVFEQLHELSEYLDHA